MDPRISRLGLGTSLSALKDLFLPRLCIVCGRQLILQEEHLCTECLADLPYTRFHHMRCNPMADSLNERIRQESDGFEPYSYAHALFFYNENNGYGRISQALKYRRNFRAGRHFAHMLGQELAGSELFSDVDTVLAVPLHRLRRLRRGYNQAEIIAKELSKVLGARFISDRKSPLKRARRTGTQTRLGSGQRVSNVQGAFRLRKGATLPGNATHILLIDDVFTTGATLNACRKELRRLVGAGTRISVATLAFVYN